ncbi:MAG TPA: mechanosensitive ion channel family protein [Steroidobacteraceae bacterium]
MSSYTVPRRFRLSAAAALAVAALAPFCATAKQPSSKPPAASTTPNAAALAASAKPASLLPLTSAQVLKHVRASVSWYRDLATLEQISLPGVDPVARGQLQQQAITAVHLAFDFGKAAEDVLGRRAQVESASASKAAGSGETQPPAPTLLAKLDQEAAELSSREAGLKAQLSAVDTQLRRAKGARARAALGDQRAGVAAGLQLVQQIESNVDQLRRFEESALSGQGKPPKGLRAQLAYLEKSVPELATGAAPGGGAAAAAAPPAAGHASTAKPAAKSTPTNFQPQSAGIVTLIGQWLALHQDRSQIAAAGKDTTDLQKELTDTRSPLLASIRQLVGSGLASIETGSSAQLAAQRPTIEAGTEQLRELSGILIPLGEQALTLSNAQSTLDDWSHTLASQESTVASYLGVRVGFLLGWIAAVLIFSEIWRRATFRYLPDARRRRPFLVLRRVVIGLALVLVVIFSLVSSVGSVATYAGFVTAGVAVALQNVILAVVAYFFLIGRYGVRVGDRVTISGVTGRVVDISLLRIYLMELSGPDLHSTGRMVVLSNAVLFQPTALFKQIPGAEYLWHGVTLTIVATADVEEAYSRLQAAANKVYDTYRAAIERQHALAQRFIEFETEVPAPEVRVRLTDNGLECAVRYPVIPEKSARIDQQMLDALHKAVERDENLKLVASGGMVLKSPES